PGRACPGTPGRRSGRRSSPLRPPPRARHEGLSARDLRILLRRESRSACPTARAQPWPRFYLNVIIDLMNRLAQERSPYLLQHARNPVDWFSWSDEAFAKARAEDKPIFLSVGYSTCHWC